jgi:hypothetical protein
VKLDNTPRRTDCVSFAWVTAILKNANPRNEIRQKINIGKASGCSAARIYFFAGVNPRAFIALVSVVALLS